MLAFLGFGDLGKQLFGYLQEKEGNVEAYYFDDILVDKSKNIFLFNEYQNFISKFDWVISLGYNKLAEKQQIIEKIIKNKGKLVTIIHHSSYISASASVKSGTVIYPMCNIDKNVILEEGVLLNNSVTICHDTNVGMATYIGPGVIISGNCKIGRGCFIGSGSIISNGVEIGDNSIIGIGSVVTKNIEPNTYGIGNPFRVLRNPLKII